MRLVLWAMLALVLVAPCLHLAAGPDHPIGGKHAHQGLLAKVPWASGPPAVTPPAAGKGRAWFASPPARLPLVVARFFVPPEA